jgi:predicted peptidase
MNTNKAAFALLAICFILVPVKETARAKDTGFLNRVVEVGKEKYRYQVYVPADWSKSRTWPVVLFLHGAGERGQDGLVQTEVGIGTAIRRHPDRFPCIVVMPQCRTGAWWTEPAMEQQALKALDQAIKEFKGDNRRVYLTGLSMGGFGTWSIASKYPARFAALAPICGGVRPPARLRTAELPEDPYTPVAEKVASIPIWIFHGGADKTVPASESRKMNEALTSFKAQVKYTEYEGVGHNSWDRAYGEKDFMAWLLGQRR